MQIFIALVEFGGSILTLEVNETDTVSVLLDKLHEACDAKQPRWGIRDRGMVSGVRLMKGDVTINLIDLDSELSDIGIEKEDNLRGTLLYRAFDNPLYHDILFEKYDIKNQKQMVEYITAMKDHITAMEDHITAMEDQIADMTAKIDGYKGVDSQRAERHRSSQLAPSGISARQAQSSPFRQPQGGRFSVKQGGGKRGSKQRGSKQRGGKQRVSKRSGQRNISRKKR